MGHRGAAARTAPGATIAPGHLGRGAGLIDEHQALGIEIGLRLEPGLPAAGDVRPLLLAGVCGFFERHPVALEEAPHRALRDLEPVDMLQVPGDLRKRHIKPLIDQGQDLLPVGLDPLRAIVATLRPRPHCAALTPLPNPSHRRRGRNPKALSRPTARHAALNRRNHPSPQIF